MVGLDDRRQPGRLGEPEALDAHAGGAVGQDPGDGLQVGHGRGRAVRLEALGWRAIHGHLYHERVIILLYEGCRSEEHTSELQSLMRISYAVFCLKTKKKKITKLS